MHRSRLEGRGQSEVLGVVLLFTLVLVVSGTVVVVGGQAIDDVTSTTSLEGASTTMLELQSAASQTSDGSVQRLSFARSGNGGNVQASGAEVGVQEASSVAVDPNAGSITINVTDVSDGESVEFTEDLGTLTYASNGQRLVYQGGGVFRTSTDSDRSAIVSPPVFDYRYRNGAPTLSIGFTTLGATEDVDGRAFTIRSVGSTGAFPTNEIPNPLEHGDSVNITVESEYHRAWASLFRARTDGRVTTNDFDGDGKLAARLQLNGPPDTSPIAPGGLVTSRITSLNPSNHAAIDSYNSTSQNYTRANAPVLVRGEFEASNHFYIDGSLVVEERAYLGSSDSSGERGHVEGDAIIGGDDTDNKATKILNYARMGGDVHTTDDLYVEGDNKNKRVDIAGNVYVGGSITKLRNVDINGTVYVQGDLEPIGSNVDIAGDLVVAGSIADETSELDDNVGGTVEEGAADPSAPATPDLEPIPSANSKISAAKAEISSLAESDPELDEISSDSTACTPCTLTGSNDTSHYYIPDGIDVRDGERLVFDTSEGPIEVYVGPNANGENGIYLKNGTIEVEGDNPVRVYSRGDVRTVDDSAITTTPENRSQNFVVFVNDTYEVDINSGNSDPTIVTGVYRAPNAPIEIDGHGELYGAAVGEITNFPEYAKIHYDEALFDVPTSGNSSGDSPDQVKYLHVTTTEITVEE